MHCYQCLTCLFMFFLFAAEKPKLQQLLCFQAKSGMSINIMQRVGTQYTDLGIILLEDEDGSIVDQITSQYQLNAVNITREILKQWIRGGISLPPLPSHPLPSPPLPSPPLPRCMEGLASKTRSLMVGRCSFKSQRVK